MNSFLISGTNQQEIATLDNKVCALSFYAFQYVYRFGVEGLVVIDLWEVAVVYLHVYMYPHVCVSLA